VLVLKKPLPFAKRFEPFKGAPRHISGGESKVWRP